VVFLESLDYVDDWFDFDMNLDALEPSPEKKQKIEKSRVLKKGTAVVSKWLRGLRIMIYLDCDSDECKLTIDLSPILPVLNLTNELLVEANTAQEIVDTGMT